MNKSQREKIKNILYRNTDLREQLLQQAFTLRERERILANKLGLVKTQADALEKQASELCGSNNQLQSLLSESTHEGTNPPV